jgi:uncharacterized protein
MNMTADNDPTPSAVIETPASKTFPAVWPSIGWVAVFVVMQFLITIITLGVVFGMDKSGTPMPQLAAKMEFIALPTIYGLIIANLLTLGFIWLYLRKAGRKEAIGLDHWTDIPWLKAVGWAVGLVALGLAFNYAYGTYVVPDVELQEQLRKLFAAIPDTMVNNALLFFAVAMLAPLVEELVFRGLLQKSLSHRMPIWAAILIASALFALVHFDPKAFPILMGMGVVFGVLYHKTGSLRANIAVHMVNNAAALLLT